MRDLYGPESTSIFPTFITCPSKVNPHSSVGRPFYLCVLNHHVRLLELLFLPIYFYGNFGINPPAGEKDQLEID